MWHDIISNFLEPFLMMLLGVFTHFITELKSLKDQGKNLSPLDYWTKYPYRSILTLIWGVVGFMILKDVGNLTATNAFLYGYMSDSLPKTLTARVGSNLSGNLDKLNNKDRN